MPRPRLRSPLALALPLATARSASTAQTRTRTQDARWQGWQPTVGLELHVQLRGNPKLFSHETATYDATPNTHVAPFDAALPGTLPTLHPTPLRLALVASLALKADINPVSRFDRKHYFYPDLTPGWQITQRYAPLATGGYVRVRTPPLRTKGGKKKDKHGAIANSPTTEDGQDEFFTVRLEQVQLEQDTAKSFHDPSLASGAGTLVDLNRAGAALIEIVTKPDMRSPEEAAAFVKGLQSILRSSGVSGANMDKGELRCDVNVSVSRLDPNGGGEVVQEGTRCEVKNLNGVRFIAAAIESEIKRQISVMSRGERVESSTLGFSATTLSTFHLRSKESSPDYRYMPDPELPPLSVSDEVVEELRRQVGELPTEREERVRRTYGLGRREVGVLVALGEGDEGGGEAGEGEAGVGVRWFEEIVRAGGGTEGRDPKVVMNWLIHTLLGLLSRHSFTLPTSPVSPNDLGALIDAVTRKRMTGTEAKALLGEFIGAARSTGRGEGKGESFAEVLRRELATRPAASSSAAPSSDAPAAAMNQDQDPAFDDLITSLLSSYPAEVEKIRAGNAKVVQRLVGEAMKRSKGRADARRVAEEVRRRLGV